MEQEWKPSVVESQIMFGVYDFSDVFSGLQITKQFCNDRASDKATDSRHNSVIACLLVTNI